MQETLVWSLGQEDPLKEEMATYSSILAWRVPQRSPQSMGSQSWTELSDWAYSTAILWKHYAGLKRTSGMLRTKYTDRTKCWRACGGHGWVIKWRHGFGKHLVAFFKSNHRPWSFSHLIPRYFPREKKECVHRDLYLLTVYRCFTCGGPKPGTTQISINRWSDEETVVYPHSGM